MKFLCLALTGLILISLADCSAEQKQFASRVEDEKQGQTFKGNKNTKCNNNVNQFGSIRKQCRQEQKTAISSEESWIKYFNCTAEVMDQCLHTWSEMDQIKFRRHTASQITDLMQILPEGDLLHESFYLLNRVRGYVCRPAPLTKFEDQCRNRKVYEECWNRQVDRTKCANLHICKAAKAFLTKYVVPIITNQCISLDLKQVKNGKEGKVQNDISSRANVDGVNFALICFTFLDCFFRLI